MNKQEIFKQLIAIGNDIEKNITPSEHTLVSLVSFSQINTIGPFSLETSHFTNSEVIELLKGLIYVERKLKWLGGSVATGRFIFDQLLRRNIEKIKIDEVAAWVLQNTNNDFMPFGTQVTLGATNYTEFIQLRARHDERTELCRKEREKIEREAKRQREMRKLKRAHGHQYRKHLIRSELIKKINDMSVHDQLLMIAHDEKFSPNFYPTSCAKSASISVIQTLPHGVQRDLAIKMKGEFRGPWGRFKKRLIVAYGKENSESLWNSYTNYTSLWW